MPRVNHKFKSQEMKAKPKHKPTEKKTGGDYDGQFMSSPDTPLADDVSRGGVAPITPPNQTDMNSNNSNNMSQLYRPPLIAGLNNYYLNPQPSYAQLQQQLGPLTTPYGSLYSYSPQNNSNNNNDYFNNNFGMSNGFIGNNNSGRRLDLIALSAPQQQAASLQQTTIVNLSSGQSVQLPPQPSKTAMAEMRWEARDAPRFLLSAQQDAYLAAIVLAYSLLRGYAFPVDSATTDDAKSSSSLTPNVASRLNYFIIQACRPYDVEEDSTSVVESELETMVYYLQKRQPTNNISPLVWIPPLFDQFLTVPLRLTVYGEMNGKFPRGPSSSDFTWKHTFERKLFEEKDVDQKTVEMRAQYFNFLVKLYEYMWEAMMLLKLDKMGTTQTHQYMQFLKKTFADMKPQLTTTIVLEAKIKALAAQFQLIEHVFFNTYQFLKDAQELNKVMDFTITQFISSYLYLIR